MGTNKHIYCRPSQSLHVPLCTVTSKKEDVATQTYPTPGPCPSWETHCHLAGWTTPT